MAEHLDAKIRSIEAQLKVLRASVKKKPTKGKKSFSDLKGILKGKATFSEEEIKKAKIQFRDPSLVNLF
jgi:hypothetical protein